MFTITKQERIVIVFLIGCLLLGIGAKVFRTYHTAPVETSRRTEIPSYERGGFVNINDASAEELMTLKGIGRVLAHRIVAHRNSEGIFTEIDEIKSVKGIGEKVFNKIKNRISVQ